MNFSEALELLKKGKKVSIGPTTYWLEDRRMFINGPINGTKEAYFVGLGPLLNDDWEEYKEPLLTEEEKEYLRMVIKFHPEKITSILVCFRKDYNLVYFEYKDDADCVVTTKDYFKNLKENHSYTLEELGL